MMPCSCLSQLNGLRSVRRYGALPVADAAVGRVTCESWVSECDTHLWFVFGWGPICGATVNDRDPGFHMHGDGEGFKGVGSEGDSDGLLVCGRNDELGGVGGVRVVDAHRHRLAGRRRCTAGQRAQHDRNCCHCAEASTCRPMRSCADSWRHGPPSTSQSTMLPPDLMTMLPLNPRDAAQISPPKNVFW